MVTIAEFILDKPLEERKTAFKNVLIVDDF